MMMTCRLLCALLVLALCCCSSVFAFQRKLPLFPDDHDDDHNKTTYYDHDNHDKTQPRPPPLQHRHQVLRLQRRQLQRPPAHRHVFAKSTAASAALRGCVPRWLLAASALAYAAVG
ncbi:putative mucin TcMUCI [Trypanosoma cruzi]|nr:putative mucin TcMUCI [Trypanosoma cruzi]